ncbi:uncharacterized protein LOC123211488, partial [Mangifera indica]|uniref:uncharacterized protein LOC123211488 n=1 Tax=Mangifera indica TaxID=29780 RepID=UPI001CFA36C0
INKTPNPLTAITFPVSRLQNTVSDFITSFSLAPNTQNPLPPWVNSSFSPLKTLYASAKSHLFGPTNQGHENNARQRVCATNDKTVSVEVLRLDSHPNYKKRIRKKKKYQAHDPDNQFQVGDVVQLQRARPISKTKSFVAVLISPRTRNKKEDNVNVLILEKVQHRCSVICCDKR